MNAPLTQAFLKNTMKTTTLANYGVLIMCALLVVMMIIWVHNKSTLNDSNCKKMDGLYKDFPKIHNVNTNNDEHSYKLRDYYIKTAYNACCAGNFKNDFVNICALKNCIKQGARCLDFEVYSLDNEPVIATSSVIDYTIKETYNSIPFSKAMSVINNYAFSAGTCPNHNDPLIIHLRIMSSNKQVYDKIANQLKGTLLNKLLGTNYSYENNGKNIGMVELKNLVGKVIISADKSNPLFEDTKLDEYVNIASNSIFMRAIRYSNGIKYAPDIKEVINFNKKCMSICMPDVGASSRNLNARAAMKCGVQFIGMCMQNFDENMQYYDEYFDSRGSAFVLKPEPLRFVPVTIPDPTPPPKEYSYEKRKVKKDFYNFSI